MASLRAELTGRPDSVRPDSGRPDSGRADQGEPVLVATEESIREHAVAASHIAEPPISTGRGTLLFAGIFSLFWVGASAAFLFGYFGPDELATLAPHILAFSVAISLLPPFLFIAAAYTLVRAQAMTEAARRLTLASERLLAADDNAVASAQRIGRAVRRELDALSQGMDSAFGRMRALEKVLEERIAQLDEAGARAGVKTDAIAQRLKEERDGIEQLTAGLEHVASRTAESLSAQGAQLKAGVEASTSELRSAGQQVIESLDQAASRATTVLNARGAELKDAIENTGNALSSATQRAAESLHQATSRAVDDLTVRGTDLRASVESTGNQLRGITAKIAEDLDQATSRAASGLSGHQASLKASLDTADGELRATTRQLVDDVGQAASRAADLLSGRAGQVRAAMESTSGELRGSTQTITEALEQALARATETLAGRGAQLKAMIEATAGELRAVGQLLETQSTSFIEASERAAAAPHAAAVELDRQSKVIEGMADASVARAEFVLARQERQRVAMQELLVRLKDESGALEATLTAQRDAIERAARQLAGEAVRIDELSDQGLKRLEAAMGTAATRTAQMASGFGRETDRVKDAADAASSAMTRLVETMREAATSAQALIADSTSDAKRRSLDFVGEAMGQCDQLLRAASHVAEEAEKARAALSKAGEEAERHIVKLPGVAAQEAERVRETLRSETEKMLDISARALATIQTRSTGGRGVPNNEPARLGESGASDREPPSDGLRGLARRITAPKRRPPEKTDLRHQDKRGTYQLSDVLAAAEANEPAPRLKPDATVALGELQTALADLAVDLDTAMSGAENPQMWRRYLDGDQGVFARRLASSIGPEIVDRISAFYRDNSRFHEAADLYLREFETLLARAREGDRGGLLASSLLSADTGKIYLAVAYALGRLE